MDNMLECDEDSDFGLGQLQLVKTSDISYWEGTKEEWFDRLRIEMNAFYRNNEM